MVTRREVLHHSLAAVAAGMAGGCAKRGEIPGTLIESGASLGHRLWQRDALPPVSLTRRARVVIAGGGVAGLAAARRLRAQGVKDTLIIDALNEAGGHSCFGQNAVSAYPWGAHYVPLVRNDCQPVLELFRELKIIVDEDAKGQPVYDEYCLSADPQERLWMYGQWQDGLIPQLGSTPADHTEFTAFFAEMERLKHLTGADGRPVFAIPVDASSADPAWRALDAMTFSEYLRQKGYRSPLLHWYVNYCCRDDYGSPVSAVSAWAGLHYFAARSGTAANADSTTVLTWPEGNGHLVRELASSAQLQLNSLVTRVARTADGVTLDYFDVTMQRSVRVEAAAAVICLPRFVAARIVEGLEPADSKAFTYSPWMVANVTLSRLPTGRGQALAWDNVIFDSALLGYVVATHQSIQQVQRDTVITYYWPLSEADPAAERKAALARSLGDWQTLIVSDLLRVHPELKGHIQNIDVRVWGHAMVRPTPGFLWGEARRSAATHRPPIFFAHSDLSGISVFEEAYCRGYEAGGLAARGLI